MNRHRQKPVNVLMETQKQGRFPPTRCMEYLANLWPAGRNRPHIYFGRVSGELPDQAAFTLPNPQLS